MVTKISRNDNIRELSDTDLQRAHESIHKYAEDEKWDKENLHDYHSLVKKEMKRRRIPHMPSPFEDNLDEVRLTLSNVNDDYFKTWSTPMAYMLGFITADATIHVNKKAGIHRLSFEIQNRDRPMLEKWAKQLGGTVKDHPTKDTAMMQVHSPALIKSLFDLGLRERKEGFPRRIPKEYLNDFIRGFYDGNGTAYIQDGFLRMRILGRFHLIRELQRIIKQNTRIESDITKTENTNYIQYLGKKAITVAAWMYKNKGDWFYKRKYDIFPKNVQNFDAIELEEEVKYAQPLTSGTGEKDAIQLGEVLGRFEKPMRISMPFVYLTGSIVNRGESKNDIDILIKASKNDESIMPVAFRLIRMFPEELRDRIQIIYDDTGDSKTHGPFTSHIPLYSLELVPIENKKKIEMTEKEIENGERNEIQDNDNNGE